LLDDAAQESNSIAANDLLCSSGNATALHAAAATTGDYFTTPPVAVTPVKVARILIAVPGVVLLC
jgi:hypothetical protein